MNDGLIKSLAKESAEQFRQRLDKLPGKKLVQELTEHFEDKDKNQFTVLSYLIQSASTKGSPEKFQYSLEKLSQVKDFNLADYLNSYRMPKSYMVTGSPLYLLAAFNQSTQMMQDLYNHGIDPNVTMTNTKNVTLDGESIAVAMSTKKDQSLVEKHKELKARYLQTSLSNDLNDKPPQKKVKL
jgi:hypothetical protein